MAEKKTGASRGATRLAHDYQTPPRLAYRVGKEAAGVLGMSRWSLYRLIDAGELKTVTIGSSRHITDDEMRRVLGGKSRGATKKARYSTRDEQ